MFPRPWALHQSFEVIHSSSRRTSAAAMASPIACPTSGSLAYTLAQSMWR